MSENKLKKIRTNRGITQCGLANLTNVNVRMIQKYEQGERNINKASGETLYKLSKALNCNIEDLLDVDPLR
ncbi:helix-turn-helix domain-containing protein [Sellimonas caecigallum]|uniref:Helix-turn-helix transcriptional regulator n=1 Tax=Sellimonas caecigallum TaxID=2592333 RepID=A0ABS7L6V6_9FIRM|nr:helix-turn-helix transcriptional regulator [Sellimonas caecigallum]MBY0758507.1 helix-turn-helix transcriptional regulator [Sellimonas caecigallum]